MIATIEMMCAECHNYFDLHREIGDFKIEDGKISLPFLEDCQFFRIVGSKFNDGVYIYSERATVKVETWEEQTHKTWSELSREKWGSLVYDLVDEEFHGGIWAMAMPRAFLDLSREVSEYLQSEAAKPSPYTSESFGGYSYQRNVGMNGTADNSWQTLFRTKLNRFRKAANI